MFHFIIELKIFNLVLYYKQRLRYQNIIRATSFEEVSQTETMVHCSRREQKPIHYISSIVMKILQVNVLEMQASRDKTS